jgi:hypothetical protein
MSYSPVTLSGTTVAQRDYGFLSNMDFGDLPSQYRDIVVADNGARHVLTTTNPVYLGTGVTPDADGKPGPTATDDTEENGVTRVTTAKWLPGQAVNLTVSVVGSNGYLVGWFDWNNDGDLADAQEQVVFGSVPAGSSTVALMVGSTFTTTNQPLNVRFRLYAGQPSFINPTGLVTNGEVEDYQWAFADPTAVTLTAFTTRSAVMPAWLVVFAGAALASVMLGAAILTRKRG